VSTHVLELRVRRKLGWLLQAAPTTVAESILVRTGIDAVALKSVQGGKRLVAQATLNHGGGSKFKEVFAISRFIA
jgi:hypothetical protein